MNTKLNSTAALETAKMIVRQLLLWLPVILAFLVDIDEKGLALALSTFLTTADKYIHERKDIKATGIVPF